MLRDVSGTNSPIMVSTPNTTFNASGLPPETLLGEQSHPLHQRP